VWLVVAAAVFAAGVVGAVVAASAVADSAAARARRDFRDSSAEISATLQLAIQHEEDLIVNAGGFVVGNPVASNAAFNRWASSVHALQRYPEVLGFGNSVIVPRSQLAAFAARAVVDPTGPLSKDGRFEVVPPGIRPFYCLSTASVTRNPRGAFPAGYDFCTGTLGPVSLAARDSGKSAYLPIRNRSETFLSVLAPMYRNGVVPKTVSGRRRAFLGWVGMEVEPRLLLDRALKGHAGMAVSMRYRAYGSDAVFRGGTVVGRTQSLASRLHNGWTVTTFAPAAPGGLFAVGSAVAVLVAGIASSLFLTALLFALATGRARAWRLVGERTDELRHQALHDALTGLPNRELIMDRIEQLLARSRRNGVEGAALFVDLDEFKNVNDTLGHEAGDQLLRAVGARLTTSLREVDTIGRMGGDEFVILLDGGSRELAPDLVAERLLEVMRQPFELDSAPAPITVTTSIGIASGGRQTAGELLRNADVALYQAKAAGRNCYETFRPEMEADVNRRYELEFDLRSALEGDQFRLVYQPIYNLDDLALVGVEALLRWQHPTLGEIQPNDFIPLLEASGHIVDVGGWVLQEACTQMAKWRSDGSALSVSVNVSGRQLDNDTVVDQVRDALADSHLDPEALTIEITETTLMRNLETTAERLHDLKHLGVRVAIDDFGTGYSSLAHLQRFPVDSLKIDRAFTGAINKSPESDALIRTLVQLGKDLGLTTLAEGIETPAQIDHLRDQNVNEVQGFLLARPLDPHTLETQFLRPAGPRTAAESASRPC
jgi:diguanylate cyclase (GGDEF)-like protein